MIPFRIRAWKFRILQSGTFRLLFFIFILIVTVQPPYSWAQDLYFTSSVPIDLQQSIGEDLKWLEHQRGDKATPLFRKNFGHTQFSGKAIVNYITSLVPNIHFIPSFEGTAFFARADDDTPWMVLGPVFLDHDRITPLMRITTLLHEAHHANPLAGLHILCPDPYLDDEGEPILSAFLQIPIAGKLACDADENGAYGLEYVVLKNIELHCDTCSPEKKREARRLSQDAFNRFSF